MQKLDVARQLFAAYRKNNKLYQANSPPQFDELREEDKIGWLAVADFVFAYVGRWDEVRRIAEALKDAKTPAIVNRGLDEIRSLMAGTLVAEWVEDVIESRVEVYFGILERIKILFGWNMIVRGYVGIRHLANAFEKTDLTNSNASVVGPWWLRVFTSNRNHEVTDHGDHAAS